MTAREWLRLKREKLGPAAGQALDILAARQQEPEVVHLPAPKTDYTPWIIGGAILLAAIIAAASRGR